MHVRPSLFALAIAPLAIGLLSSSARADRPRPKAVAVYAHTDDPPVDPQVGLIGNKIFVDRCKNGCTFTKTVSTSNSRLNQTWLGGDGDTGIPGSGDPGMVYTIPACGTATRPATSPSCQDAVFQQVLDCVAETYAPYDVVIVGC